MLSGLYSTEVITVAHKCKLTRFLLQSHPINSVTLTFLISLLISVLNRIYAQQEVELHAADRNTMLLL